MKKYIEAFKETIFVVIMIIFNKLFGVNVFLYLAIFIGGLHTAIHGLEDMFKNKSMNADLLMFVSAVASIFIGHPMEGAVLILIFTAAHSMEDLTLDKSKKEIEDLLLVQPDFAWLLLDDGELKKIESKDIKIGDRLSVSKSATVPIDGVIVHGNTYLGEAMITGESMPKDKTVGDRVYGGTHNFTNPIVIEADTDVNDTVINKIVRMVEETRNYPSKTERFIDNLESKYSNGVVVFVALYILVAHFATSMLWEDIIYKAMTLFVVASPCALVASVSPATIAAISRSAKEGVLVKGGVHFENLKDIKVVAFDKTGTLTEGTPKLNKFIVKEDNVKEIKSVIKTIESRSTHPLAKSIVEGLSEPFIPMEKIHDIKEDAGHGVSGVYQDSEYFVGKRIPDSISKLTKTDISNILNSGLTASYIYKDDIEIGYILLEDRIRQDAKYAINELHKLGIKTAMITGDNESTAEKVSKTLGLDIVYSNVLPDEKSKLVIELEEIHGPTAMIGDGINDAPALANATVGVAMGAGADVAMDVADIIFVNNNVSNISQSVSVSRKLNKIVKQNIIFSLSVIALLIFSTIIKEIPLPLGVIGHEGSTIIVILNGLRLLKRD